MLGKRTVSCDYRALIILLLSFGLFSCTTTTEPESGRGGYHANRFSELFDDVPSPKNMTQFASVDEALDSARQTEQQGDLDKALFYYIQSLQFSPDNAAVFLKIAQIQEQQGNNSIAAQAYSEAVKNDPTLILAYQGLGVVHLEMRKYQQAQEYLLKAITLDQERLSGQGGIKEGEYYLLDQDSPFKAYNVSGVIEDMHGNFALARTYYNLALSRNENSANLLSNIGYSYYLTGELNSAERYLKRAINADNQFKRAWTNLGLIYVRKGQYNRAVKTLKQVMKEFEAYNDLGYFLMLDGHLEQAEYFFQKAIDNSPSYFEKAYSNLEQVQIKMHELWLLENEAPEGEGDEIGEVDKMDVQSGFSSIWSGISAEMALENGS